MNKKAFQIRLPESASQVRSEPSDSRGDEQAAADRDDLETLSLVVSRASNAILIMDASGVIQWTNEAFSKLSGYEATEAVGCLLDELVFGPSTDANTRQQINKTLVAGEELTTDVLQYRSDGTTLWVECKLIPVSDDSGETSRWIVIESDVTRRRQTEEALLAAKKSAEANSRSKSEFLANMSHEIRTPLNAILGMTELALTTDLSREQRDYIQTVKTSADALLDLLNDVLDITKIEAGKMEIEEVDFNLAEVVRETTKALAVRAHEKGLELAVHMPMTIPHELRGDPTRIRQVLFNLIGNAIKFTSAGEIVVDVQEQWQTDDEVCMQFSVSDTGIGIPKERLQKIFDAFTQVDSSMARRFGGSGLGLTITSKLVRLMNGKLWVQSSEGKGSTFHFTLTLKLAASEERSSDRHRGPVTSRDRICDLASQNLDGKRVLIVDDNATNRRILNEMLGHWGLKTTLCDGAAAALKELESAIRGDAPFDLVILDAMMPVVDGFQLAEMMQQRPDLQAGTVMMLSSADRPTSTHKCKQLGIESYLVKPVSASALLEAIVNTLATGTDESAQNDSASVERGSMRDSQFFQPVEKPLRVLLVDDHEPNRKLVESILKRRGHDVRSECDGEAAILACQSESFDVVLMDVQMPGRDGFSATKAIRENEANTGRHSPIIALTAHALKGDRERCLAAGMDSYLAKPIHAADLVSLVEQIGRGDAKPRTEDDQSTSSRSPDSFNIGSALERMGGELDLLKEHIGYVINDMPQLMQMMVDAIEQSEPRQLEIAAHRMKSLVSSYDHTEARELAQQIEQDAKHGRIDDARDRIAALRPLVESFTLAVDEYLQAN
ncbi:PAS domain-containing hybrid sensor histidine kinase/response regulator [Novipirellula caenicola]|uniref:histidine kinase n=1 Tax=Novipirellula caenicola TaxID=1536901 RepID=A0ABP9VVP1_9BACT